MQTQLHILVMMTVFPLSSMLFWWFHPILSNSRKLHCAVPGVVIASTTITELELCMLCCNQWPIMQHNFKHSHTFLDPLFLISTYLSNCRVQSDLWLVLVQVHFSPLRLQLLASKLCSHSTCNHLMFPSKPFCIQHQRLRLPTCPRAQRELHKHFQVLTCVWTENPRFVSTSLPPSSLPVLSSVALCTSDFTDGVSILYILFNHKCPALPDEELW